MVETGNIIKVRWKAKIKQLLKKLSCSANTSWFQEL